MAVQDKDFPYQLLTALEVLEGLAAEVVHLHYLLHPQQELMD